MDWRTMYRMAGMIINKVEYNSQSVRQKVQLWKAVSDCGDLCHGILYYHRLLKKPVFAQTSITRYEPLLAITRAIQAWNSVPLRPYRALLLLCTSAQTIWYDRDMFILKWWKEVTKWQTMQFFFFFGKYWGRWRHSMIIDLGNIVGLASELRLYLLASWEYSQQHSELWNVVWYRHCVSICSKRWGKIRKNILSTR